MIIRKVSGRNIKGCNFEIPLVPANAIVGPNSAGKTAILQALRVAMLGYEPTVDKTNQGIFSLASAGAMSAQVETSEGHQIERAYSRDAKGSVKKSERVPQTLPPMPVVMLDANDYLGRSESERMEQVAALMNFGEAGDALGYLAQVRIQFGDNPAALALLKSLAPIASESVQQWLERAIAAAKQARQQEQATVRAMEKTQQSLANLQVLDEAAGAEMVNNIASDLQIARDNLEAKRTAWAQQEESLKQVATRAQRRLTLSQRKSKLEAAADNPDALVGLIAQDVAELAALRPIAKVRSVPEAREAMSKAQQDKANHSAAITSLNAQLVALENDEKEVLSHKTCPTCSTNKPTWKENAQKKFARQRDLLTVQLQTENTAVAEAAAALASAQKAWNEAEKIQERIGQLERALEKMNATVERAQRNASDLQETETELAALGDRASDDALAEHAYRAQCEYDEAKELLDNLLAQQEKIGAVLQDRKRLQQAADQATASQQAAAEIAGLITALEETRAQHIASRIKPLLEIANAFAEGILPTPLAYSNGEIGRMDAHGRWIPTRCFSGAEQLATHAALSAALGSQSPIRLLIIDEMGRFDPVNKRKFLRNAVAALHGNEKGEKKLIDQIIVADVDAAAYEELNAQAKTFNLIAVKAR